jgi:Zn-dependent protease with chaperone function
MTSEDMPEKCPECGGLLSVTENFPVWCSACEWGISEPELRKGIFRSRADRWSARQAEALFRQVSGSAVRRPGWSLARFVSYALAICVHLFCIALVAVGIWLIVAMPNIATVILAVVALLLAFELRPRVGSFRTLKNVRYRKDAPVLFGVLDHVAAEVGAKPVQAVITNARWNASYRAIGWRRRRVVTLGLPLWDALPADQKIAVLGHEFAHGVNGDTRHGAIVGTSLATLNRLHTVLRPGARRRRPYRRGSTAAQEDIARLIQAALSSIVAGVLMLQELITLRAHQRAEYLADVIAARVASPASMADALDTTVTGRPTYAFVLDRRRFRQPDTSFWDQLRSALSAVPEGEIERRRRVRAREQPRVTDTHPPAHLRIKMMRKLPASEALISLSADQEEKIYSELAGDYARIGQGIDDARLPA